MRVVIGSHGMEGHSGPSPPPTSETSNTIAMPAHPSLSDDHVAEMLKRDAEHKGSSSRFVASGLGALLSGGRSRPRGEAPKPNARFLKNLVRELDSHNAALKVKEEREARRRMWDLQRGKKGEDDSGGHKRRHRSVERYAAGSSGRQKKARSRSPSPVTESEPRRRHHESEQRHRSRSPRRREGEDDGNPKRRRRSLERYAPGSGRHKRARFRSRSASPESKSKRRHRHKSPISAALPKQEGLDTQRPRQQIDVDRNASEHKDSDSDPLEGIIGPQPPPQSKARGRGAENFSSTMDDHFKASYDPKTDSNLEPEEDRYDWDMALEALRDRAKWKQTGAERLRAAGFTEEEVSHWQNGTGVKGDGEKDVGNVRWSKQGEDREWDRGKVMEGDHVEQRASWLSEGRLKDT